MLNNFVVNLTRSTEKELRLTGGTMQHGSRKDGGLFQASWRQVVIRKPAFGLLSPIRGSMLISPLY